MKAGGVSRTVDNVSMKTEGVSKNADSVSWNTPGAGVAALGVLGSSALGTIGTPLKSYIF